MRKASKSKEKFLHRVLKCFLGITVSTAVTITSIPVNVLADNQTFNLHGGILRMLSAEDEQITEYTKIQHRN